MVIFRQTRKLDQAVVPGFFSVLAQLLSSLNSLHQTLRRHSKVG